MSRYVLPLILLLIKINIFGCADGFIVNMNDMSSAVIIQPDFGLYGYDVSTPEESQMTSMMPADDRCLKVDITQLSTCCEEDAAHCVPATDIPPAFQTLVGDCELGYCVPDKILTARREISLLECQSIGGPGRCLSVCIPQVAEQAALLPLDICDMGEKCVPCINPLNGMETGVCGVISCVEGMMSMTEPEPPVEAYSCENPPTEPVVDPNQFSPCCDGAHCIPADGVSGAQRDQLEPCDNGAGLCVPDKFITSGGFHTPITCNAPGQLEGRCMSTCIPQIAAQLEFLSQEICDVNERCVPCCDPRTGISSDVCGQGCDEPLMNACTPPVQCCAGYGTCLAPAVVPEDQQSNLKDCERQGREDLLCVPNEFLDQSWVPQQCTGQGITGDSYAGVCLPDCLRIPFEFILDPANCPDSQVCAPCQGPFGGPTGAPGCN